MFSDYQWKFKEPLACFCYMYSTSSFVVWLKASKTQNILWASAWLILSRRRFERKLLPKSRLMLLPFNDFSSCKKVPFLGPRKKTSAVRAAPVWIYSDLSVFFIRLVSFCVSSRWLDVSIKMLRPKMVLSQL